MLLKKGQESATIPSDQYFHLRWNLLVSATRSRVGLLKINNTVVRQVSNQQGRVEGLQGNLHAG
jgi:hypothetical protein